MTIFLVRHCSATGQEPSATLTPEGITQSLELAVALRSRGITRIVSSPFTRAISSAEPLAQILNLEIIIDPRLAERNLGTVPGGDWLNGLKETFNDHSLSFEGGESSTIAMRRARTVIDESFALVGTTSAIFTHGNLLSLIARSISTDYGFDFWQSLKNPDVFQIQEVSKAYLFSRIELKTGSRHE